MTRYPGGPGLLMSAVRYRWFVLSLTLLSGGIGCVYSLSQPVEYEATAELLLTDPRSAGIFRDDQFGDQARYVNNQAQRIVSTEVAAEAAALLDGRYEPRGILEIVGAVPSLDLDLITITATEDTPQRAADAANAVAQGYQDVVTREIREQSERAVAELAQVAAELRNRVAALDARLREDPRAPALRTERDGLLNLIIELETKADRISIDAALFGSGVEVVEPALLPERPVRTDPVQAAGLGVVLGLALATGVAWLLADRRSRAENPHDPTQILRAPLLETIPEFENHGSADDIPAATHPWSPASRAFGFLLAATEHRLGNSKSGIVLITSALPDEGKTLSALNLAAACARNGQPVVLLDADLRTRGLTKRLSLDSAPGIDRLVATNGATADAIVRCSVGSGVRVPVVAAGSMDDVQSAFFRSQPFVDAVKALRSTSALVLCDSPPLLSAADASLIAAQVDGIVLVVARGTPLESLETVRERLDTVGVPLLGYIFNARSARDSAYGRRAETSARTHRRKRLLSRHGRQ